MKAYTLTITDEHGKTYTREVSHFEYVMLKNLLREKRSIEVKRG